MRVTRDGFRFFAALAAAALAIASLSQAPAVLAQATPDSVDELEDFRVPARDALWTGEPSAPTPVAIPGANVITTGKLKERLADPIEQRPFVLDVLGGSGHDSLPGAVWLPGAGRGIGFDDAVQPQMEAVLAALTNGSKARALVFVCSSKRCWLSYNAALRAVRLGYTNVHWYRGGIAAWIASGGPVAEPRVRWRRPPE